MLANLSSYFGIVFGLAILPTTATGAESQFWIIRAANETAVPLKEAVEEQKLPPDELASRITKLIGAGKIQQLARYDQPYIEGKLERKTPTGTLSSPKGELFHLGINFEAEIYGEDSSSKIDLRVLAEITEEKSPREYFWKTFYSSQSLYNENWTLLNVWNNGSHSTLLLARVTDRPPAELDLPATSLEIDLLEIDPADLAQFRKSTPETRQKAMTWLRQRSKLLATGMIHSRAGNKTTFEDATTTMSGEKGGFTCETVQETSSDGRKVDVSIRASWQNRDKPSRVAEYQFAIGSTLDAKTPQFFEPTTGSNLPGALPVLLVTPKVTLPNNYTEPPAVQRDPATIPDKISFITYPVAAHFSRTIHGPLYESDLVPLEKGLGQHGLEFPMGTSVGYHSGKPLVLLNQNREGHLKFMQILKTLKLQP